MTPDGPRQLIVKFSEIEEGLRDDSKHNRQGKSGSNRDRGERTRDNDRRPICLRLCEEHDHDNPAIEEHSNRTREHRGYN